MLSQIKPQVVWAIACVVVFSCQGQQLEEMFFSKPLGDRLQRLREYSLEDQYRIFRYGNDVIEPPLTDLAGPIAERGADAVPFLVRQLNSQPNDLTVMDVLLIFKTMASSKSYDVKGDSVLMDLLASKIAGMESQKWQSVCSRMFEHLKHAK
jgi:hypothetical protein